MTSKAIKWTGNSSIRIEGLTDEDMPVQHFQANWAKDFSSAPNGDWVVYGDQDKGQGYRMKFSNLTYDSDKAEASFDVTPLYDSQSNEILLPGILKDGETVSSASPVKVFLDFGGNSGSGPI